MEVKEFVNKLKTTKPTTKDTGFFGVEVRTNKEHTRYTLHREERCSKCGSEKGNSVTVELFKPTKLTIFEAEMLFSVYCLGRKPHDYANYHKCVAGREFIENIKSIEN